MAQAVDASSLSEADVFLNSTLAALDAEDMAALYPNIVQRHRCRGEVLTPQGGAVDIIYFPATAQIANVLRLSDGRSSESFLMGSEGVTGLAAFLADEPCAWSVEVRQDGIAYEIAAAVLRKQFDQSASLRAQLLRLCYDYQAQAALSTACSMHHLVPARLATAILLMSERLEQSSLDLTQDDLSGILGVQRTSVNAAALSLRANGAIKYSRGIVHIADVERLRIAACECAKVYEDVLGRRPVAA